VLTNVKESKLQHTEQPQLFLSMHIAQYQLAQGQNAETKPALEEAKEKLASLNDVDPAVSAAVHYVSSLYYKAEQDFAEFYKSSLQYLAFVSSDQLEHEFKLALAVDISLAALLGKGVYNFGELLLHPIVKVLDGSSYAWLGEVLAAFNHGDLHAYDQLCEKHAGALNSQPALVQHERALREKITILALTELIFNRPPDQRAIPVADIARATKLTDDGVEFLLMKALSLHLIEGSIDQVAGTVQVSWVQPRVLTLPQIDGLLSRLGAWISKVSTAATMLQDESTGLI
jgi:26S proteasome regulatory subunit N9